MWIKLVAMLFQRAGVIASSRGVQIGTGLAALSDILNIDILRHEAIKLAPGSDRHALDEAARVVLRWLGGAGEEVMWPTHKTGPLAGQPIAPNYMTIDMAKGRAWFHEKYYSAKSSRRRFGGGGFRRSSYRRRYR